MHMRQRRRQERRPCGGFTLVELLVVIVILSILAFIAVGTFRGATAAADAYACRTRMVSIGAALGNYLVEKQTWPQPPEYLDNADEDRYWEWWAKTMEPYGLTSTDWRCPTDERELKKASSKTKTPMPEYYSSYMPTEFEAGFQAPTEWNQPWVIERTDFHGSGQHLLMRDGKVIQFSAPQAPPRRKAN
jgi:prepilin-type N-terminal cleavage/methylation domain-containing protein